MRIETYDSVESYARLVEENPRASQYDREKNSYGFQGKSWDDGVKFNEALRRSRAGDPSLVKKYSQMTDKLVQDYQLSNEKRKSYPLSVAGSRVFVPAYLSGSPYCMRRREEREMQVRSVNIYVGTTCSAGIPADAMIKRGATILALLEYLQLCQVHVELYLTAETHGDRTGDLIQVIRVESHPLDLSVAGFAIAHPAFARRITYAMAWALDNFNGNWPTSFYSRDYRKKLADALGMTNQDIYVPPPVSWDGTIFKDPEGWLNKRIEHVKKVGDNFELGMTPDMGEEDHKSPLGFY